MKLLEDESMVSFDLKSLFANVQVDEALEVVHKGLVEDNMLIKIKLPTCWSCVNGPPISSSRDLNYYKQMDGAAMGSPVSFNIYMEMFEKLALRTATHSPQIWRRYVDDTFCMINYGDESRRIPERPQQPTSYHHFHCGARNGWQVTVPGHTPPPQE